MSADDHPTDAKSFINIYISSLNTIAIAFNVDFIW